MENNLSKIENIRKEINGVTCKQLMLKYLMSKYYTTGININKIIDEYRFEVTPTSDCEFSQSSSEIQSTNISYTPHFTNRVNHSLSKQEIRVLFYQNGIQLPAKFTFAHKGDIAYWANPNVELFTQPYWFLVLGDDDKNMLHYFKVDSSVSQRLIPRHDKPHLFDVQIDRYDINFVDKRSGVSFLPYLVKSIKY